MLAVIDLTRSLLVEHVFAERLADSLDRSAIQLSAHDHRIDHAPDVVDRDIGHDLHRPGLRIDLDLRDVRAVWPAWSAYRAGGIDINTPVRLAAGQLEQADGSIRPGDPEHSLGILDVGSGRLQRLRRQIASIRHRHFRRVIDRRSGGEQRARARAAKSRPKIGIARDDADTLDLHAEYIND